MPAFGAAPAPADEHPAELSRPRPHPRGRGRHRPHLAIWRDCRTRFGDGGGDFLFGGFTIADAMYAPVVSRFRTYCDADSARGRKRLLRCGDGAAGDAGMGRRRPQRADGDRDLRGLKRVEHPRQPRQILVARQAVVAVLDQRHRDVARARCSASRRLRLPRHRWVAHARAAAAPARRRAAARAARDSAARPRSAPSCKDTRPGRIRRAGRPRPSRAISRALRPR